MLFHFIECLNLTRVGTATIFINDDGLQIIPEEEAQARKNFYHDNNIGWVSRPKHGKDGYLRRGKFKKASNMNFALNISKKVEEYLEVMVEAKLTADGTDLISQQDEDEIYKTCLERVLKEDPRAQAAGHIRMGELILIIDSDTRVVRTKAFIVVEKVTDIFPASRLFAIWRSGNVSFTRSCDNSTYNWSYAGCE